MADRTPDGRSWVILRKPGNVPEKKGPFRGRLLRDFLREVMRFRMGEFVEVVWMSDGELCVEDGGVYLEMADGRSRPLVRRHRASLRALEHQVTTAARVPNG